MLDATWSFRSLDSLGSVLMVLLQEIFEKNLGFFLIWNYAKLCKSHGSPTRNIFVAVVIAHIFSAAKHV
jgi:hypothetical protein